MNQYYGYVSVQNKVYIALLSSVWEMRSFQNNDSKDVKRYIPVFEAKSYEEALKIAKEKYLK